VKDEGAESSAETCERVFGGGGMSNQADDPSVSAAASSARLPSCQYKISLTTF
jgi:hypothetical protein